MKKIIKKLKKSAVTMLALSFMLVATSVTASADSLEDLGKTVDGSVLTTNESSEAVEKTLTRGNILDQGIARISNKGNRVVNIYGATLAYVTCDKLIVRMYLQQYKNGAWVNYGDSPYGDTVYNASSLSRSYNVSVAGGYYYRVKAGCVAQKGSTTESQNPVTDGIWID